MKNRRWLGYELSVLRRIKFNSIAIPFSGQPDLDWYLKFWGKQVFSNDICQWAWWTSRALVENQQEVLGEEEIVQLLHNTYVPRRRMNNPALSQTMSEMDAWWFDNLWLNIQQIENPHQRALAYYHALGVGDYVHSFTYETAELRRPLSEVFEDLWRQQRKMQNNEKDNRSTNLDATEFISAARTDLMFAHFPRPEGLVAQSQSVIGWRETWVRGSASAFAEMLANISGLGDHIASKGRYLDLMGRFLENAKHIPKWAIAHPEDGFVTAAEMGELIKTFRPVEVTYAKDFSEISGGLNTYIIVA
ncbi:MAG TPA: hypothetical protein VFZ34_25455 [Blastocatellia bacterium]|nr:hypothetical protein [Blastocatellia bacterium]